MNGRDTDTFRNLRRTAKELAAGCSHPEIFAEIVAKANALAFLPVDDRDAAIFALDVFMRSQPCIIWQPEDEDQRHITVEITREREPIVVAVSRAAWAVAHVVSQQGRGLLGTEELQHTCGKNGHVGTGYGVCINPSHLVRGNHQTREQLKQVRKTLRSVGLTSVATA
jgi:hypothetical protein